MTWVVPLALGGVAILVMAVFTMLSARKRHRANLAPATVVGPRVLIHDINDDRCTGCDACVAVCPTNVLDLVANKSRVLRFHDCIQCEACMFACPTTALVMFPEGGVPPSLKVPEMDENFQTAVPGQYLIGEVSGKPLVKSAANLGRAVVEHMLATGLVPGALGGGESQVDVAIVGSGPGGLSAALTCIQKGLSYVVLEKEQMIASTIARYPKGKLVMAEPYDTSNLSLLPVFDSAKEQLIPVWREVIERVGLTIKQGESVETVQRGGDGVFDVRTTVAAYRAQRVVLSIGTRGKPRTLQVPGENLPKIYNLLEDPDDWRGKAVLVIGGGDSACEAALALADAGAKVMISYRGKGFNRAAPKNKQAMESYASQGRVKAKLGSQVVQFDADSVTLALSDGSQKRYPNDGTFVLIGADPPIAWLEKMGVRFVDRPHQYQLGKTDDIVRRFLPGAVECPEDAARAAAQVLGGSVGVEAPAAAAAPAPAPSLPMPMGEPVSGPRKWLRSATSIFSNRSLTNSGVMPVVGRVTGIGPAVKPDTRGRNAKKFDAPVPLSEFAKRSKTNSHIHTGHGRRDALSAGERTRILRMLRDEGGRLAYEDDSVNASGSAGRDYDFDFDDSPAPAPAPAAIRPDVPAKPAVVVGIAQAQAARKKAAHPRPVIQQVPPPLSLQPPAPLTLSAAPPAPPQPAPLTLPPTPPPPPRPTPSRSRPAAVPPTPTSRRPPSVPFGDEPTRQVDDDLLTALRNSVPAKPSPRVTAPLPTAAPKPATPRPSPSRVSPRPQLPKPSTHRPAADDEARRAQMDSLGLDDPTRALNSEDARQLIEEAAPRFRSPVTDPDRLPAHLSGFEDNPEEATRLASLEGIAAMERARHGPSNEERTRAVNIRNDPSISDIDWDLD
ncbi:MAG TPA: NAD(P)-binding domain-containing protein [Kofleriaceae bacterium]|nr:NAD(P)-binding domain-containing protein [Kofleriaceae bacterium]